MSRRIKYGDEHNEEILKLYVEDNMSLSKIAQKFGMHPEIVKRKLKSMGVIAIRNKSEAMIVFHQHRQTRREAELRSTETDFPVIT